MKYIFLIFLIMLNYATFAHAEEWQCDPKKSRLEFEASYEKQPIKGIFPTFDCRFHIDKSSPDVNKLDVIITLTSADMFNTDINDAIKTPAWFDAIHFPQAEFHSQHIKQVDATHYIAQGILQIKNLKKEIEFPFTWTSTTESGQIMGSTNLIRTDFDIGNGEWASDAEIGHNVKVSFTVNVVKAK